MAQDTITRSGLFQDLSLLKHWGSNQVWYGIHVTQKIPITTIVIALHIVKGGQFTTGLTRYHIDQDLV